MLVAILLVIYFMILLILLCIMLPHIFVNSCSLSRLLVCDFLHSFIYSFSCSIPSFLSDKTVSHVDRGHFIHHIFQSHASLLFPCFWLLRD